MTEKLIILRRTPTEIKVFGGDVYVDIDGKNIGILGEEDIFIELQSGNHTLKMYKSHNMGTFIGIAKVEINMKDGSPLFARYAAPYLVNQSGTIIITDYESETQLSKAAMDKNNQIERDFEKEEAIKRKRVEESQRNGGAFLLWVIIIPIVTLLIWYIIWSIEISSL